MASIRERNGKFNVIYSYTNEKGERKQKWETYETKAEAKRRKKEIEYKKEMGSFVVRKCKTLDELITEYVALYGKENEDDEVISLSPSYLLESPSFDDGMMEIQLQKRLQIFLLNKICQSKTHGQTVSYALYYLWTRKYLVLSIGSLIEYCLP